MVKISFDDTPAEAPVENGAGITLTEAAARRIAAILEKSGTPEKFLRLAIVGGGCSGFSYSFKLDDTLAPADIVITCPAVAGPRLALDVPSYEMLKGSTVDFEETLEASQFVVKNPNAKASCGCGSSFSV